MSKPSLRTLTLIAIAFVVTLPLSGCASQGLPPAMAWDDHDEVKALRTELMNLKQQVMILHNNDRTMAVALHNQTVAHEQLLKARGEQIELLLQQLTLNELADRAREQHQKQSDEKMQSAIDIIWSRVDRKHNSK